MGGKTPKIVARLRAQLGVGRDRRLGRTSHDPSERYVEIYAWTAVRGDGTRTFAIDKPHAREPRCGCPAEEFGESLRPAARHVAPTFVRRPAGWLPVHEVAVFAQCRVEKHSDVR